MAVARGETVPVMHVADSSGKAVQLFRESGEPRAGMFMEHLPTEPVAWLL